MILNTLDTYLDTYTDILFKCNIQENVYAKLSGAPIQVLKCQEEVRKIMLNVSVVLRKIIARLMLIQSQ